MHQVEMAEAEYMVRATGYLKSLEDFNHIVLKAFEANGVPVYLKDVARDRSAGNARGIAEMNGKGEVAAGRCCCARVQAPVK
ncbi:hypothetical protein ACNKHQ_02750 [Shigella flexneri]